MMNAQQVEQNLRADMAELTSAELLKFAKDMGVQDAENLTMRELREECVMLELHCAFH